MIKQKVDDLEKRVPNRSQPGNGSSRRSANPVIGVKKPTKETTRDRVLTDDEIRRLWDACATQNAYVGAWFRLRLVTAQHGGELLQMRCQDIDPKSHFWTIPGEFVKNAHCSPNRLNDSV